ncbi:MAG TPA: hypothetical protein VHP33_00530 [Polyangiaceae bacterium]|nr:hypothetical protein [Polyangiaceae bacterium]
MKARLLRGVWVHALAVLLSSGLGGALAFQRIRGFSAAKPAATPAARPVAAGAVDAAAVAAASDGDSDCLALREAVWKEPVVALPPTAAPELRAQLLGRTKNVPVLFLSRPEAEPNLPEAAPLRQLLETSPGYQTFDTVVGKVRRSPELARAVFLREGYLYTENPELAALYGSLTLSLLFRDPELSIVRGAETLGARRLNDGDYEYTSGDERGRRAKLLLFDRVAATSASSSASRHVDLRALSKSLGFDELAISRATTEHLAVEASYGATRVPTLLSVREGKLSLVCEAPGKDRAEVQAWRAQAARLQHAQAKLVSVIKEQVDEALPFDEPKTEEGQQDGKLRPEWRNAYLNGSSSFEFNGDRYAVFDAAGRPRPPQVCIDFVLDTFERAGGSWWQSRDQGRQRVLGRLQFDDAALENRRSVERFIEFARSHTEAFEVYEPAPEARVPLRNRALFFAELYRSRAQFRRGDIVAILGPRDDEKLHYHSFFIVDADPLSGMPTELAANAGRPRIRSWEGEMQNAPRRSISARIRPRPIWLEALVPPAETGVSADELPPARGPEPKPPQTG